MLDSSKIKKTVIIVLILFVGASLVEAIYYPWMYYLPYGLTVTLKPLFKNESDIPVIRSCKWVTPGKVELFAELYNYDISRYSINKATCELTVYNNQRDTNGVYHCVINEFYISKAMLNVHGAPKASLIEEYTPNLIAGFSTFGGIIALFVFSCSVYKFRYREPIRDNIELDRVRCYNNQTFTAEITANNDEPTAEVFSF